MSNIIKVLAAIICATSFAHVVCAKEVGRRICDGPKSDVRVIEVHETSDGGCELSYFPKGAKEKKSTASSGFGSAYCWEVAGKIQASLMANGFECKHD